MDMCGTTLGRTSFLEARELRPLLILEWTKEEKGAGRQEALRRGQQCQGANEGVLWA
jgi:hypothetical protein